MAKKKNLGGRPTLYKEQYCEEMIEHMSQGYSFYSFAGVIGVNRDTLHRWLKTYKQFSDAKTIGHSKGLLAYEKTIWHAAHGKIPGFNSTAAVWFGKNVHLWADRVEDVNSEKTIKIHITAEDENL